MKLSRTFLQQVRIPTSGMEKFEIIHNLKHVIDTGLYDELRYTSFYRNLGQLEDNADRFPGEPLVHAYYVQREDGVVAVDACDSRGNIHYEFIKEHLDPHVKATVITCRVPACHVPGRGKGYLNSKYGGLEFLAQHHPLPETRILAIGKLMELCPAPERTGVERGNYRAWLQVQAQEVGLPCA